VKDETAAAADALGRPDKRADSRDVAELQPAEVDVEIAHSIQRRLERLGDGVNVEEVDGAGEAEAGRRESAPDHQLLVGVHEVLLSPFGHASWLPGSSPACYLPPQLLCDACRPVGTGFVNHRSRRVSGPIAVQILHLAV
jgi:hypothetical protein